MRPLLYLTFIAAVLFIVSCEPEDHFNVQDRQVQLEPENGDNDMESIPPEKIVKTESEWKKRLTPLQYKILRLKGTERPYTGQYNDHYETGTYRCAACGNVIFTSRKKFPSHCGWPSFSASADKNAVDESVDTSHGMIRTEITCQRCGSHLGHVFNDGPPPTGLRYCINSAALTFEPDKKADKK